MKYFAQFGLLVLSLTIFSFLISCETPCKEDKCTNTSVNFKFRILDSLGNDLVFGPDSVSLYNPDSIRLIAQNEEAISSFEIPLIVQVIDDTVFYFRAGITSKHNRFFLRGEDSIEIIMDTIISKELIQFEDTVLASYITEASECCGILINRFDIGVNGETLCNKCQESQVYDIIH